MFQAAQLVHGDDVSVAGTSVSDIDLDYFRRFYKSRYEEDLEEQGESLGRVLSNMRLLSDGVLTVSGILVFAKNPQILLPVFNVKAVCYPGHDIHATTYLDSADIVGRLQVQFEKSLSFILRNLRREQHGQGINTTGELEIPRIVLEELVANALIHRDHFVSAPVRVLCLMTALRSSVQGTC
jgi:ATP-dependent DNA helicase RecG